MKRYSRICENWGIDPDAHREDFEWVKGDPLLGNRLTRELGMYAPGTRPVRLARAYYTDGSFAGFYRIDTRYRYTGRVSVSARDFHFDC